MTDEYLELLREILIQKSLKSGKINPNIPKCTLSLEQTSIQMYLNLDLILRCHIEFLLKSNSHMTEKELVKLAKEIRNKYGIPIPNETDI